MPPVPPGAPRPSSRHRRTLSFLASAAVLAGGLLAVIPTPALAANTTYYVDAVAGIDTNTGPDQAHPWKSLGKVNATTFGAGDRILLKSGSTWTGQLWPKGSGAAGSADRHRLLRQREQAADQRCRCGRATRCACSTRSTGDPQPRGHQHVPATGTPGANLRDLRGIHVSGDNSQTLDGFVIDAVDVHDVTGQVNWIGGDSPTTRPGIHFKTGWDGSKKTGGIVFDTTVPEHHRAPATPTLINDVVVAELHDRQHLVRRHRGQAVHRRRRAGAVATPTGWGTRTTRATPSSSRTPTS